VTSSDEKKGNSKREERHPFGGFRGKLKKSLTRKRELVTEKKSHNRKS